MRHNLRRGEQWMEQRLESRGLCNFDLGGGGSAPDNNPGAIANAQASEKVGLEQVQLGRDQLQYAKDRNTNLDAMISRVVNQQLAIGDATQKQGEDYYKYNLETYRPLEKSMVDFATNYNNEDNQASRAMGDVDQAIDTQQGNLERNRRSYGIDPSSGAAQQSDLTASLGGAAMKAGAATNARNQAQGQKFAYMQDAASLGRNLASNSATSYGVAINAGNGAAGNSVSGNNAAMSNMSSAQPWFSGANTSYGTAGNIYNQDFSNRTSAWNAQQQANATGMAGLGAMAGQLGAGFMKTGMGMAMFAKDGGFIDGKKFKLATESLRHYADGSPGGVRRFIAGQEQSAADAAATWGEDKRPAINTAVGDAQTHYSADEQMARLTERKKKYDALPDAVKRQVGPFDPKRMAEGGETHGPGGPTGDKIPAMLSDGEYVIPADVVRAKGTEYFDRLREKYHTPA